MPTYEITTDGGKYEVTTEESSGQNPGIFDMPQEQQATQGKVAEGKPLDVVNMVGQFGKGVYTNPILHPILKYIAQGTGSKAEQEYAALPVPVGTPENISAMLGSAVGAGATAIPLTAGAAMLPVVGGSAVAANALGMGAYGGAEALARNMQGENVNVGQSMLQSAGGGALMGGMGRLGASIVPSGIPGAERIGSALGGAAAGALTAPEGQQGDSAMLGGLMGAVLPSERFNAIGALANGVGPIPGLGYEKTAVIMGKIFNKSIGDAVRDVQRYGGIDEVRKIGEWSNVAPDGTKQTMMDVAQATREQGVGQVHKVLSDQFERVLPAIEQINLGKGGEEFLAGIKKEIGKIAEPPTTSALKNIWEKYQDYLYKTTLPRETLEKNGIRIVDSDPQDLSALDKEAQIKIEGATKRLQKGASRSIARQDLPEHLLAQIEAQEAKQSGPKELSPTALDRLKRELSTYGHKGAETVDKAQARKIADRISTYLKDADSTGAYRQLMDHYTRLIKVEDEVGSWDAVKLSKQYKGTDPTSENAMNNSIKVIDNYFKSGAVAELLKGRNTNFLTEDLINKYHTYQTLANPNLFGFSHVYPLRVMGGAMTGMALGGVLGPLAGPIGGVAAWKLSNPQSWMPLINELGKGKTTGKSYTSTVNKTRMAKGLLNASRKKK